MNAVSGRRRLTPVVLTIALGFSAVALAAGLGLRINVTPSAPIGLWLVRPARLAQLQRDDYVLVCPPRVSWIARLVEQGALLKGECPSGVAPFIKRVAALPGTGYTIGAEGIRVASKLLANTRPLLGWPYQNPRAATVPGDTLLVYQDAHPGSLDSRYLGPFPLEGRVRTARLLVAF